jgi:leader peptidase (prepilin peptidase) / N-methyltransferase
MAVGAELGSGAPWGTLPVMDWVIVAAGFLLGLLLGSFGNVVIARVPEGRSVVRPPSACPACGRAIPPRDNVPVLS